MTVATFDRREGVDLAAAAMMLGLTFSWGVNGVAAKVSYAGFDPIFISIVRSLIGGTLVVAWCLWRGIGLWNRDGTLIAGALAGLLFGLEFLLLYVGLDHTTVSRSTLLVNTMPFWVLIGGHYLLGEHITIRKVVGLLLAFAGLVAVFSDRLGMGGANTLLGDLLSLAAGLAWALTNIVIKRTKLTETSAEKLLLYQLAGAAIVGAIAMPFAGPPIRVISTLPVVSLLFQSIYIVAITYVLWFWLLRRYPASGLASFTFLTPVFGVVCGGILLGEHISPRIFLALALIATGLIIVNRPKRPGT